MTPTEDDGSKRRGLAPVTRKKRLPEALSWRLWGWGVRLLLPLSVQERGLGGEANRSYPFPYFSPRCRGLCERDGPGPRRPPPLPPVCDPEVTRTRAANPTGTGV